MATSAKSYDIYDLSDVKGSLRSRFRNLPFEVVIDSLEHDLTRQTALALKKHLLDLECCIKGPIAKKRRTRLFKYSNVSVPPVKNAVVYRNIVHVSNSTYLAINAFSKLELPITVNLKIVVSEVGP